MQFFSAQVHKHSHLWFLERRRNKDKKDLKGKRDTVEKYKVGCGLTRRSWQKKRTLWDQSSN